MTAQASDPLSGSVLPTGGGSESPIGNTCRPPTTRFPVPPSTDVAVTALDSQNRKTRSGTPAGHPGAVARLYELCVAPNSWTDLPSDLYRKGLVMTGDEIVRAEEFKIERFMSLGLGRYEAIKAVEAAIDWNAVVALLKTGCALTVALETAR